LEKTRRKARRSTARRRARYILQEERARTSRLHVHCTLYPLQEGRSDRRSARRPVAQHSLAILVPPPSSHAATAETRNLVLVVALVTKPCTAPRTGPIEALCIVHRTRPRERERACASATPGTTHCWYSGSSSSTTPAGGDGSCMDAWWSCETIPCFVRARHARMRGDAVWRVRTRGGGT
jgi:hypothetical protein